MTLITYYLFRLKIQFHKCILPITLFYSYYCHRYTRLATFYSIYNNQCFGNNTVFKVTWHYSIHFVISTIAAQKLTSMKNDVLCVAISFTFFCSRIFDFWIVAKNSRCQKKKFLCNTLQNCKSYMKNYFIDAVENHKDIAHLYVS